MTVQRSSVARASRGDFDAFCRGRIVLLFAAATFACAGEVTSVAGTTARSGAWGSDQASLAVADSGATLRILASGGCYGSYGQVNGPIPAGSFSLSGVFTQLIGAYPGKIQYAAQFSGTAGSDLLSMTVSVPSLQRTLGPFTLAYGATKTWPMCLYP